MAQSETIENDPVKSSPMVNRSHSLVEEMTRERRGAHHAYP